MKHLQNLNDGLSYGSLVWILRPNKNEDFPRLLRTKSGIIVYESTEKAVFINFNGNDTYPIDTIMREFKMQASERKYLKRMVDKFTIHDIMYLDSIGAKGDFHDFLKKYNFEYDFIED